MAAVRNVYQVSRYTVHLKAFRLIAQSDPSLAVLERKREEMVELWNSIGQPIPQERDKGAIQGTIPTIESLHKAALREQASWKTQRSKGFGRVRDQFVKFASGLEDYAYLAKIIPDGDKYTSLIAGTVSSIVQASSKHPRVIQSGHALTLTG